MARVFVITHPDVVIDPAVPVSDWPLSERGRARMAALRERPWIQGVRSVFASGERKAMDGAAILAGGLGLDGYAVVFALHENDRSATGYLPKAEFEAMADRFFAEPESSVLGWERAVDAQARMVEAVRLVLAQAPPGDVAIVGHGGTATLLRCHLAGQPISRGYDQPPTQGGNWFAFGRASRQLLQFDWRSIDSD
jgi:broad specificity phosphatase PhoE